jgi:predicted signal transduction protein with EAL and GGDEF domain
MYIVADKARLASLDSMFGVPSKKAHYSKLLIHVAISKTVNEVLNIRVVVLDDPELFASDDWYNNISFWCTDK